MPVEGSKDIPGIPYVFHPRLWPAAGHGLISLRMVLATAAFFTFQPYALRISIPCLKLTFFWPRRRLNFV